MLHGVFATYDGNPLPYGVLIAIFSSSTRSISTVFHVGWRRETSARWIIVSGSCKSMFHALFSYVFWLYPTFSFQIRPIDCPFVISTCHLYNDVLCNAIRDVVIFARDFISSRTLKEVQWVPFREVPEHVIATGVQGILCTFKAYWSWCGKPLHWPSAFAFILILAPRLLLVTLVGHVKPADKISTLITWEGCISERFFCCAFPEYSCPPFGVR